ITNGTRTSSTNTKGATVHHQVYMTAISCTNQQRLLAELRVYSPPGDQTLPDNTVVLTVAKALFPRGDKVLLEAIHFAPFLGDPKYNDYEDSIPDFTLPFVVGLGHVSAGQELLQDGSRSFAVTTGDFIKGVNQTCTVHCAYPTINKRWVSTPVPAVNTCVQFGGICCEIVEPGSIRINLDYIVLSVAPRGSAPSAPTTSTLATPKTHTPNKRKKFSSDATTAALPSTP
ncbi:hypothetical protein DFH07DRAFT_691077, partial [Mycena maculata]